MMQMNRFPYLKLLKNRIMKTSQLTIAFISLLFLLNSCENKAEIENEYFLQKEWKVKSVVNENKRFAVPSGHTFFREEAYILKFINDSILGMNTSVNYAGGNYQIVSDGRILISDYYEGTKVYNTLERQRNFDEQLVSAFNGVMLYSYTQNKLIFRGEEGNEVVFQRIGR